MNFETLSTIQANFGITDLVTLDETKNFTNASTKQQTHLLRAIVTFETIIQSLEEKYTNKGKAKDLFYANVLADFENDMYNEVMRDFDDELDRYWSDINDTDPIDNYADALLDQAMHYKRWIEILKANWKNDQHDLLFALTDENGHVNLDRMCELTPDYRDIFY